MAGALGEAAPRRRSFAGTLAQPLRYGENPHQGAAFYRDGSDRPGVATARQLQGKALSYNNINDTDAAFELVAEFAPADGPACAIIKHANPCGVARGASLLDAYRAAYDCDRTSAFGGIVALNGTLDAETAAAIAEIFTEVVIAPEVDRGGGGGLRGEEEPAPPRHRRPARPRAPRRSPGGRWPAASWCRAATTAGSTRPTSGSSPAARPTEAELADLRFAWTVAKHVKSNAIVYARGGATVGIGAGQMSRVDSTRIAARKARDMAEALGLAAPPTAGRGRRLGRLLPLRRRPPRRRRGRRDGGDPARRLGARRGGDRRRRRRRPRHGLHRHAAFPPLRRARSLPFLAPA